LIEVRLFGYLRRYATATLPQPGTVMHLPLAAGSTVGQVLAQLGIDLSEVSNIFVNGRLLPRSAYPITLGYPLAAPQPLSPDEYLTVPVQAGDRVGIFPRNMGAVVV
jgi:hypothetical protein